MINNDCDVSSYQKCSSYHEITLQPVNASHRCIVSTAHVLDVIYVLGLWPTYHNQRNVTISNIYTLLHNIVIAVAV